MAQKVTINLPDGIKLDEMKGDFALYIRKEEKGYSLLDIVDQEELKIKEDENADDDKKDEGEGEGEEEKKKTVEISVEEAINSDFKNFRDKKKEEEKTNEKPDEKPDEEKNQS